MNNFEIILKKIINVFNKDKEIQLIISKWKETITLSLEDVSDFCLEFKNGKVLIIDSIHPCETPTLTLSCNPNVFLRIFLGDFDGIGALLDGDLAISGSLLKAQKFAEIGEKAIKILKENEKNINHD